VLNRHTVSRMDRMVHSHGNIVVWTNIRGVLVCTAQGKVAVVHPPRTTYIVMNTVLQYIRTTVGTGNDNEFHYSSSSLSSLHSSPTSLTLSVSRQLCVSITYAAQQVMGPGDPLVVVTLID
jgi:hypothetical protein